MPKGIASATNRKPSNWCKFGWHSWDKWTKYSEGTRTLYPHGVVSEALKGASYPVITMKKTCESCGLVKFNEIET